MDRDEQAGATGQGPLRVDSTFVETHGAWMLALAERLLGDKGLAEDAVQEALLAAHRNRVQFEGRSQLRTWLYRITVNAALTLHRKHARDPVSVDALQPVFDENDCRIEESWQTLPETQALLEQSELRALVRTSVDRLPSDYRAALILRDIEELSVEEVARILDISKENVKVRTHRARAALKRLLEPALRGGPVDAITEAPVPPAVAPSFARRVKGLMLKALPGMITCAEFERFLTAYLDDELPAMKRRLFEFHIATCAECREYLAAYRLTRALTQGSASRLRTFDGVPADLLQAVTQSTQL